ncbi:MAG: ATP-binding protein [Flavobacteriales bacterium]
MKEILGKDPVIFIDEAQRIPELGLTAKIITDQFPEKQLILSGSSSFELSRNMEEPLTGRKWTYRLFPVSWEEWEQEVGYPKAVQGFKDRLVYGFYPDVLLHQGEQRERLEELVNSYLYKDVLLYGGIRRSQVIEKLVRALAHQVGQEVSQKELGDRVGADPKTVGHYIDVLEQAYVIFRLPAFNRNHRNEIKKMNKVFFFDNGVRNAVIDAFQPIDERSDRGALWENFLVGERFKQLSYKGIKARKYFWRTKQQQEVDYVEERGEELLGFEFRWNPRTRIRFPKTFTNTYDAHVGGVTPENFRDFVFL